MVLTSDKKDIIKKEQREGAFARLDKVTNDGGRWLSKYTLLIKLVFINVVPLHVHQARKTSRRAEAFS